MRYFPHHEDGFTLASALGLVTILTIAGLALYDMVRNSATFVVSESNSKRAFYAAQSALELAVCRSMTSNNWHWTLNNQDIAGSTTTITVSDTALHDTILLTVRSNAGSYSARQTLRLLISDVSDYAVYISGTMNDKVTVRDSDGTPNPSRAYENATALPNIDLTKLKSTAIALSHYFNNSLSVGNGSTYPTGRDTSFYHRRADGTLSDTINVTFVEGDLEVKNGGQMFGVIVVQGDVILKNSQKLQGILYLPTPVSVVQQEVDLDNKETIYGSVIGGANVTGNGNAYKINIYYRATYALLFFSRFAQAGLPYVTTWKNWTPY